MTNFVGRYNNYILSIYQGIWQKQPPILQKNRPTPPLR